MAILSIISMLMIAVHQCSGQQMPGSDLINVGFDLKFGYGSVAIIYPNGSVVGAVKVESNNEYRQAFRRLSTLDNWHYAPPYHTPAERWGDYCCQLKRRARKALGLPASQDVGAISTLVRDLKLAAEEGMGVTITSAAASVPRIPVLFDEDLYDLFEYVGLEYLQIMGPQYDHQCLTYESTAALTGHGLAICPNVTHPEQCSYDSLEDNYYVVDYTRHSIFAYWTIARSAYYLLETESFDLDLGSDERYNNPDEKYYWEAVRELLLRPLLRHIGRAPRTILLVGEDDSVNLPGFRRTLHEAFSQFFGDEQIPEILDEDPEGVQAKGVAEFVRRRPYRPIPVKPEMKLAKAAVLHGQLNTDQKALTDEQLEP